jgi:hypothetical protein
MLAHGHVVRVKESHGIGLHAYQVVPGALPVGVDEIDSTIRESLDAGFIVFKEDTVEEIVWEHGKSLAPYLLFVKYI